MVFVARRVVGLGGGRLALAVWCSLACFALVGSACGDSGGDSGSETEPSTSSDAGSTDATTTATPTSTPSTMTTTSDPSAGSTGGTTEPTEFGMTIYPDIFASNCSCHMSGSPGGLSLSSASIAYDNLVDVESTQASGRLRVAPGAADESYLVDKLAGTHLDIGGTGDVMPKGGMLLGTQIAEVEDWINNGAN